MVHARSVERHGELHSFAGAELAGVHAHTQPARGAGLEHAPRLLNGERPGLAEDVDPAGVRCAGVEHGAGDEINVGVGVPGIFGRYDVGAEERDLVGHRRGDGDKSLLIRDAQTVAALDLDRRRPLPVQLADEPPQPAAQLLVRGRAGRRDRAADAAGRVRQPRHACLEFRRTVAGEHEVAVRVHKTRDDSRARRGLSRLPPRGPRPGWRMRSPPTQRDRPRSAPQHPPPDRAGRRRSRRNPTDRW